MLFQKRPFIHFHQTDLDSTQEEARRSLPFLNPTTNYLFTCDMQHSGKGTKGAPWIFMSSENFFGTFVLALPANYPFYCNLPQVLSLVIHEYFKEFISIDIKWPNDLMHNRSKIGGILTEITADKESWALI